MPEFNYARGRIEESLQFITGEIKEFESEYAGKKFNNYQEAIKTYVDSKDIILKIIDSILKREKGKV